MPTADSRSPITVVGITDAGTASLLPEALAAVREAELLCGGKRHLAFFPDHLGERLVVRRDLKSLVTRLRAETRATVVLASGDPYLYGVGSVLARHVDPRETLVVPAPSAFSLAAARLGWPLPEVGLVSVDGAKAAGKDRCARQHSQVSG